MPLNLLPCSCSAFLLVCPPLCASPEHALPTVVLEAGSMFRVAGSARAATAVECIVKPLVARIRGELPERGVRSLSRSLEDSLTWHLVLLGSTVGGLPPDVLLPLVPTLEALVDDALQVSWGR